MVFEIDLRGRTRLVTVEPAPGTSMFRVDIDGEQQRVDSRRLDDRTMSLIRLDRGGASHLVGVVARPGGELDVHVRGRLVTLTVNGRRRGPDRPERTRAGGEHRITAPMPGRVVRLLVSEGDEVKAHQPLVVVEAMKMANELRSPHGGRIKEITVTEGVSVEAGRLLVIVV